MVGYSAWGETLIVRSSDWIRNFKKEENVVEDCYVVLEGRIVIAPAESALYDWMMPVRIAYRTSPATS